MKNDLGELCKTVMRFDGAKGRILPMEDHDYQEYKELIEYKKTLTNDSKDDGWN